MALTRDFKVTVRKRLQRAPSFRQALLKETVRAATKSARPAAPRHPPAGSRRIHHLTAPLRRPDPPDRRPARGQPARPADHQ